jgi:hypothetical protein
MNTPSKMQETLVNKRWVATPSTCKQAILVGRLFIGIWQLVGGNSCSGLQL